MQNDIYNKMQNIYINNYEYYKFLNRKEKSVYNFIWNEIINMYIHKQDCEIYSCRYYDRFSLSSNINILLNKDGFIIKIIKINNESCYELSIERERINQIMNSSNKTKTLQK